MTIQKYILSLCHLCGDSILEENAMEFEGQVICLRCCDRISMELEEYVKECCKGSLALDKKKVKSKK
jgi:hypothetical protein